MDIGRRAETLERIEVLTAKALDQFSDGQLVAPRGANAAETYKAILKLDPENTVAEHGIRSVVQRLIANAQSAALAGDADRAEGYVAEARALDPKAAGLAEVVQTTRQWQQMVREGAIQDDLRAAAEALREDRLMPPDEPNAFSLFKSVLKRDPGSESARRGLTLVRDALLDLAETRIGSGNLDTARDALLLAAEAGADEKGLARLQEELNYKQRLASAKAGKFDQVYSISDLTIVRQVSPAYPRLAAKRELEGWVELEFTVTERGEVRESRVSGSSSEVFDKSALAAINRWEFAPVIENGRPVPVRAAVRFAFEGGR